MAHVIYEMEPIGVNGSLEAVAVHWYCSEGCRSAGRTDFKVDMAHVIIAEGEDHDWTDGTRCEWCTSPLQATKAPVA